MDKVLGFESFIKENYQIAEAASEKKIAGDIVMVDSPDDGEFTPKLGTSYLILKDNSVEFMVATPVDTSALVLGGQGSETPGVSFAHVGKSGTPETKKFFTPDQVSKNAMDILLQIYSLLYKEDVQEFDEQTLKNLLQGIKEIEKELRKKNKNNPTLTNFIEGLKKDEALDSFGVKSKLLSPGVKEKIVSLVKSSIM